MFKVSINDISSVLFQIILLIKHIVAIDNKSAMFHLARMFTPRGIIHDIRPVSAERVHDRSSSPICSAKNITPEKSPKQDDVQDVHEQHGEADAPPVDGRHLVAEDVDRARDEEHSSKPEDESDEVEVLDDEVVPAVVSHAHHLQEFPPM